VQRLYIRNSVRLNYYSDLLSKGKFTIRSPHLNVDFIDHVRKSKGVIEKHVDTASDILNINLSPYKSLNWVDRRVIASLRISSIGKVFE